MEKELGQLKVAHEEATDELEGLRLDY